MDVIFAEQSAMQCPVDLKTEIKEGGLGECPKGQAPKLQPSSK